MSKALDQNIRDEVVEPKFSFVVEAPAGSGKTTLLADRILHLLTVVENPKEIIAISFTNKAASEMHNKVEERYNEKVNSKIKQKIETRAKKLKWNKKDKNLLDSLEIMTIDSLASKITRQTPIVSRSLYKNISDDPQEIYEITAKETMQNNSQLDKLFPFLNYDYQTIKNQLINLLKKRDQWQNAVFEYREISSNTIKNKTKKYYAQELKKWLKKINNIFSKEEKKDIKDILTYLKPTFSKKESSIDFWLQFRDLITNDKGEVRKTFTLKDGFLKNPEGISYKEKLLNLISNNNKINSTLKDFNNVIHEEEMLDIFPTIMPNTCILLSDLLIRLLQEFNIQNQLDYIQVTDNAIYALEQKNIAIIFDENVSHILVDEFQDINTQQEKFLKLLTQNFAGNPKKSFFAVGDPMQSIYRFRKGEVKIFKSLQTGKFGDLNLKSRQLKVNFRSNLKIINWLNTEYKKVFPDEDDIEIGALQYYQSSPNPNVKEDGNGIQLHILKTDDDYKQYLEADYIYDKIKELRKINPKIKIAVLVRSRPQLNSLLTKMRKDDYPIQATEIDSIEYNQSFQDILCLTKALYNLNDRMSWIGILRAPWCGLKLNDLTCLFENNKNNTVWEIINNKAITKHISVDGQKRLAYIKNIISNNMQYRGRVAHRFFIEAIWRQLQGDKILIKDDLKHTDTFFELIDKSSSPLTIDFEKLGRLIKDLHTSHLSTNNSNPIEFYTIHKAKGMEFECVIIPGLEQAPPSEKHALILNDDGILSLNNNKDNNLYNYQRFKELKKLNNEANRLLYVAITRAKQECHLIGTVKQKNNEIKFPKNSFLKILEPIINKQEIIGLEKNKNKNNMQSSFKDFRPKLRRLRSKFFTQKLDINTQTLSNKTTKESKISVDNIGTFTGTIIHNYYEIIIKNQLDINNLLSKKLSYIYKIFNKNGYKESEINTAIRVIKKSLISLQKSKDGQWIYQLHNNEGMEVNYLHTIKDEIKVLIPDRTFIEDDTRWIIDYKTVFNDENLKVTKAYIDQLNMYESLFINDNYPIQKAIYFVAQGKLVLI